jgi:hypothetical protein
MKTMLDELRTLAESDEHGKEPSFAQHREFNRALRLNNRKTKVCTRCRANYPMEKFSPSGPSRNAVFFEGKWLITRSPVCIPCEVQRKRLERWVLTLESSQ